VIAHLDRPAAGFDAQGGAQAGAQLVIQDVIATIALDGGGPSQVVLWDLSPLQVCVESLTNVVARAQGWNRLASLERQAGRPQLAIAAWRQAWSEAAATNIEQWTRETVLTIFDERAGLDAESQAFALELDPDNEEYQGRAAFFLGLV
jgi:hypothetical protein